MPDPGTTEQSGTGGGSAWQVLAPMMDLATPMALRVAATLRLADLVADRRVSVEELAERAGCDTDALGRLLRHLVCHGVFSQPRSDVFAVNDVAALLRSDHPAGMRLWLDLDGFGGRMDLAFTGLLHTVRTGRPAWQEVFGTAFWQHLAADPSMSATFDETMAAGQGHAADAASGYDWRGVGHVVDVGGGKGVLLAEVLRADPDVHGTLVDLPDTVARGRKYLGDLGLDGRCDFVAGSFFDPLPVGADVYVLSTVIHDWGDDEAVAILGRCAEAARGTGRVVVIESHGTSGDDPGAFAEMDLRMLVLCGGRERDADAYTALAVRAGLEVTAVRTTPGGHAIFDCVPSSAG